MRPAALALLLICVATVAEAQPATPARLPEVGILLNGQRVKDLVGSPPNDPNARALVDGLRELGWVDGKNVRIRWRSTENDYSRRPALLQELVRHPVDVLVVNGPSPGFDAMRATTTIPIVNFGMLYAVEEGLVESLARPGRNQTGITLDTVVTAPGVSGPHGKRLAYLKQAAPKVSRVAELMAELPVSRREVPDYPGSATLGITVFQQNVDSPARIEAAIEEAVRNGANGLIVANVSLFYPEEERRRVHQAARRHRLPAIYKYQGSSDSGGLMSLSDDQRGRYRRSAYYIDKILKGASPATLPVQTTDKLEFVINLKTAQELGLTIPGSLLQQADRVIR